MKIISFFLCILFVSSFNVIKASSSLEYSGIYYLEVIDVPKGPSVFRILNQNEQKNLETTNLNDFGNLTRIPVVLTAKETYGFGEHVLEKDDKITVCYHFNNYKIIKNLDKKISMQLPKEFETMTEWQAFLKFANTLLGEEKFNSTDSVENVIAFMNALERDHYKNEYKQNWIKPLFWRKTS